ncbi:hypothetical protein F9C07_399 [Aspergillus flavus]|uniref:Uncharacterized protein n=5 Tax=Aspergillus subgen. Circumdati TaxID=2720871 RepID=B8MX30_ASPFN|nr:unnamed protein product [Aspergillus oryzae RIB40]XP_041141476.1 uncharacterized protein G4B84_001718 [Aspergillus flavus NRRL3357]EIT77562.1 hypothetical protein Ao3042_06289 [Aspergillus oryzae 3.042]KAB8251444.1 hypothetical protein BDV35DRAFT_376580 [Aspergillus flavus]KDE76764.1 hypothetical protein AO1008_02783 [Aspergillus oryzae 100-8]OOO13317.1 hypothetical protein OAory_01010660 [Aspergillus oryzae]KAF7627800.1 hypothetical protein AFLA_003171 [Aspergillus flavus NRRL3357]|eukprot:EIT77562.1 hypothetical protein Ao3042_06289 [Aspergillus oryzae 3.042]
MASTIDLGKLTGASLDLEEIGLPSYESINAASADAPLPDKDVATKAVQDAKEVPSIWFVNFPTKQAAAEKKVLADFMQSVQDYRCWASLIWWRTVYSNPNIPQDGKKESVAKRSAYAAKVGVKHMKTTPWLGMNVDHDVSKDIECSTSEFHTQLLEAVLQGFVGVVPAVLQALEGILKSLAKTVEQSTTNTDSKTVVCERYEYIPEADVIRSYVRLISFTVTDSMRNVEKAKKTERRVKCTIAYNEYEAVFNRKLWDANSEQIEAEQKKAADEFRKQQTVDCPP